MSKNLATATVAVAPTPATSGTTLTVATGTGARLFVGAAVLAPASTTPTPANAEIVAITDVTGDVVTITRAQESSTARTVVVGDTIQQGITAGAWDALLASVASKAPAVHAHSQADVTGLAAALAAKLDTATATGTYAPRAWRGIYPGGQDISALTGQALAPAADIPTFATAGPGGAPPITGGYTNQQIAFNDSRITPLGTVDVTWNALSTDYAQNQCNDLTGAGAAPAGRTFYYHGADLAIGFRNAVGNSSRFWVWVDGRPTTSAPVTSSAVNVNSLHWARFTWGAARLRRLKIYTENLDWGMTVCGFTDTVTAAPKPPNSLWVVGDSYAAGSNAASALQGWPWLLGRLLDAEVYCAAQPGTGYTTSASTAYGAATRIARMGSINPTWLMLAGSINDGPGTNAGLASAAASTMSAWKAQSPASRLLVMSVQDNAGTMSAGNIANDATVAAAAATAGAAVIARPISENWITGTGRSGTPTVDGNADIFVASDGIHLTTAGHEYYAQRTYRAIAG